MTYTTNELKQLIKSARTAIQCLSADYCEDWEMFNAYYDLEKSLVPFKDDE